MRYIHLVILLAAIGTFTACGHKDTANGRTCFYYNEPQGVSSLDPAFANNKANIWPVTQLFNGLVELNDSLLVEPCIAKQWAISADGLTYTFTLRSDVYFNRSEVFPDSVGRKVTAADFLYSFNRIKDSKTASPGEWVFRTVADGGFAAPNDTTFTITLKEPYAPFLQILTMPYCVVVPREGVEKYGKDFRSHPVGTGPFFVKYWYEGNRLILWKNPNYFERDAQGQRLPYLDAVSISFIADKQVAFLEFAKGQIDMLQDIDGVYKDELLTKGGTLNTKYANRFYLLSVPYLNTEYMGFLVDETLPRVQAGVYKDKRIRQALNYAIDRDKMARYLRNNMITPATAGFVPKGMPSFSANAVKGYGYNPAEARRLLKEAGYPNGNGLPQLVINTTANYLDICEFIQSELSAIGVNSKIEVNESATHRKIVANQGMDFFRGSWLADYPDAENYLSLFYSKNFAPGGPNYTHFKSAEYDKLFETAMRAVNDSTRFALYQQLDNMVVENAPVMFLYYDRAVRFVNRRVSNFTIDSMNRLVLKRVRK